MTIQEIVGVRPVFANAKTRGPYGWLTPYIVRLASHNEEIAARVLMLTREELHFIALTLALMGGKRDDSDHFAAFARSYGVLTRKTLLAAMAPDAMPALANLTPKLGGALWAPALYCTLAALFNEPDARKSLRHLKRIKKRHVMRLAGLPAGFRTIAVIDKIYDKRDLGEIAFAIEAVRRIRADLTGRQILMSLERSRDNKKRNWVMRHYATAPFPPAPVSDLRGPSSRALLPLESYDALAKTALEFKNCIRTYLIRVLRGDSYFYRYAPKENEPGVAVVELRRAPIIGWIVHETFGPNNNSIKSADRRAILHAFADIGVGAAPQAVNPNAWFDLS